MKMKEMRRGGESLALPKSANVRTNSVRNFHRGNVYSDAKEEILNLLGQRKTKPIC